MIIELIKKGDGMIIEKVKKLFVREINKDEAEMKEKQLEVLYMTIDNAVYEAEHNDEAQEIKESIETVREAQKVIQDYERARQEADRAKQEKIESWTRIGTTLVKTVVYVGLGVATYELNKYMTLLVFNEQFSKGVIDNKSLNNLLKANDSLKKDIMNNLNKRDGIL